MVSRIGRRSFVAGAVQAVAGLCLPAVAGAANSRKSASASVPLAVQRLTDKVFVVSGAGCNVTVLDTPDGLAVVDGGLAAHATQLLGFIGSQAGGRPVQMLFNTHWHPEHTGCNAQLGAAGRQIIAHENTRLWLGTEVDLKWQGTFHRRLPASALPNERFYTSIGKELGGQRLQAAIMPQAHTDGDIYVHLPDSNILVAGDVVATGSYPVLDYCTGGWICGMMDATRTLLELSDAGTRVVPGAGPIVGRAHLEGQLTMLTQMAERLVDLMRKGMSAEDMLAARPSKDFDATWGDPELFITNAYPGLWGHVRELASRGYSGVV